MSTSTEWIQRYLQKLSADPRFSEARAVTPLWLVQEGGSSRQESGDSWNPPAARVTIQMAAELYPRLVLTGPAGAGKTTLLRQLAGGLVEAMLAGHAVGQLDTPLVSNGPATPVPLYVELARFERSIEQILAASYGGEVPPLQELAQVRPLLFLLDGLEEVPPDSHLVCLSALSHTLTMLGAQARWIFTCRAESLRLFRPWLGAAEVRSIRALQPRDVIATLQRQHGDPFAAWLQRADDIVELLTRPRWLAAFEAIAHEVVATAPYSRGRLLAALVPAAIAAARASHPSPARIESTIEALPALAAALDERHGNALSTSETLALIASAEPASDVGAAEAPAVLQLLADAGMLVLDPERQQVAFRQHLLHSFGQALLLARAHADEWPASIFGRGWAEAVVLAYSLCDDRGAVLRRLLANGAVTLVARCLIDAEPAERFDTLLARSVALTPPLRVMLADAFNAEGLTDAAREQLEQAGTEGYDEAGLFGRLGDLYRAAGQWHHARAAYEAALAREAGDLRYRQQLGVVCSRLGELDQAAVALEAVRHAQQKLLASAAYELGQVYIQQNQVERALAAYRQAAECQPDDVGHQRCVARALRQLGRLDEAQAILRALLDENEADAAAQIELGQVRAELGYVKEAIDCFLKAARIQPSHPEPYYQIGRLRRTLGDLFGARAALQRAVELDSTNAALVFELGQACEHCGEYDGALAAYRHAVRLAPQDDAYQRHLGALLRARGEDEEAVTVLRGALSLRSDCPEAHAELAALLWQQGRKDEAIDAYQRALELEPRNADYQHGLGFVYSEVGQLHSAAQHLQRAIELAPSRAGLHFSAGCIAEKSEQWAVALAAYARAAALEPGHAEYIRAAGVLRLRLGHYDEARKLLARALWISRRDAETHYQVGLLHAARAAWPRALRALYRAARLERSARIYDQLGYVLIRAGRLDDARAALEQALHLQPDSTDTLYHHSMALEASGELEAAYQAARHAANSAAGYALYQERAGNLALKLGLSREALTLLDRAVALDSTLATAQLNRSRILLDFGHPQDALAGARAVLAHTPGSAQAALLAGRALIALGADDEARRLLEQAIEHDQALEPAYAALRDLYDRRGALSEALVAARRAVALAPERLEHHVRCGELLLATADAEAAAEQFELALRVNDRSVEAHTRLSQIYERAANWRRARYHAERAVAIDPEYNAGRVALAHALAGGGDLSAAIAELTRAAERAPERADWQYALGALYARSGQHVASQPYLRRAVLLAPGQAEYHYALGRCLHMLGDHAGASESFEQALRLRPEAHAWRAELAAAQIARGWHNEALAEVNRALAAAPEHARFWCLRAQVHLHLRQLDAAHADLIEGLRCDSRDADSFALLAQIYAATNRHDRALVAATRAVALQPRAQHRYLLASVLRALGRRKEAAAQLDEALIAGGPHGWWVELANDYEALDSIEDARRAWQWAVDLAPGDVSSRYRYGCVLARAGDLTEAIVQLRSVLGRDPNFAAAHARLAEVTLAFCKGDVADRRRASPDAVAEALQVGAPADARDEALHFTLADAIQSARRAVALQPQQGEHWRVLGAVLCAQGPTSDALEALRRAHELNPADAQAAFLLGLALLDQGEAAEAILAFRAATEAAPDVAAYFGYLALAYRSTFELLWEPDELRAPAPETKPALEQARQALVRALAHGPNSRWCYELALVDQHLGRHAAALESFDRCLTPVGAEPEIEREELEQGSLSAQAAPPAISRADILGRRALSLYLVGRLAEARADQEFVCAQSPGDAQSAYLLGRIAFDLGDLAAAQDSLAVAAQANPTNGYAQLFLGRTLLRHNRPAEAVSALERAAELRPAHAGTVALLSDAYAAHNRHERALAAASRAVRLDPSAAENHQRLASLYMTGGRFNEARAALINAIALRPEIAAWHAQMGEICLRLGMQDAARNAHARALQLAPEQIDYLYAFARLLAAQGRTAEACTAFEQALQHAPERGDWHYELGQLREQQGDKPGGLKHYTAAVQYAIDVPTHWNVLATAQLHRADHAAAQETLERALARFGDVPELHLAAGALLEQQQHYAGAAWHYRSAVERVPTVAEHWCRLGHALLELDDLLEAHAAFERALALDPQAAEGHAGLARIFAQHDDVPSTLNHIRRAVELAPQVPQYQLYFAEALVRERRFDEAYQAMERAVALMPDDPEVLARYGEMALNIGLNREALSAFERAAEMQPDEARYQYLAGKAHRRLKHYSRAIERYRRAVRLRPSYTEAVVELSTLGPLAFVAHHLRGADSTVPHERNDLSSSRPSAAERSNLN